MHLREGSGFGAKINESRNDFDTEEIQILVYPLSCLLTRHSERIRQPMELPIRRPRHRPGVLIFTGRVYGSFRESQVPETRCKLEKRNGRHVGTRTPDLYRVKVIDISTARAGNLVIQDISKRHAQCRMPQNPHPGPVLAQCRHVAGSQCP